jgi:hypothetical protein
MQAAKNKSEEWGSIARNLKRKFTISLVQAEESNVELWTENLEFGLAAGDVSSVPEHKDTVALIIQRDGSTRPSESHKDPSVHAENSLLSPHQDNDKALQFNLLGQMSPSDVCDVPHCLSRRWAVSRSSDRLRDHN